MKRLKCRLIWRFFPLQLATVLALSSLFVHCQRAFAQNYPSAADGRTFGSQQSNSPFSAGVCQNGGLFTGVYCSGERPNECGVLYQQQWTATCISGRCCTNPVKYYANERESNRDFARGGAVCARYGGRFSRRVCKQASNCGPYDRSACISGYCCYLGKSGTKWEDANYNRGNKRQQSQWEDEEEGEQGGRRMGNRWRSDGGAHRPNGVAGFCSRSVRFSLFMGHFCSTDRHCPASFDQRTSKPIPIWTRCIDGSCCGENVWASPGREADGGPRSDNRRRWGEGEATVGLIPNRLVEAFCYEGTRTNRQCFSGADCHTNENCVNQLCCPKSFDEMNYSCGGLASNGSCGPNGQCVVTGRRLQCVSSGVCCECPLGQPQPGIEDCSSDQQCREGYVCHSNGFCCPQCAGGGMPFGSCNKGRCAPNFTCRPGNICCEDNRFDELAIGGTKKGENWREMGRRAARRNLE